MNIINITVNDETLSRLKSEYKLSQTSINQEIINFYDTFDFRLYKNSTALYKREFNLYKKLLNSTESLSIDINQMPLFLSDLPDCDFRDDLVEITKPRKILNIFDCDVNFQTLYNDKVSLNLKTYYAIKEKKRTFIAHKITGKYTKDNKAILKKLAKERIDNDVVSIAINKLYKKILNVESESSIIEQSAYNSFKNIFKNLLITIKENENGVKEGLDIEFLHDFRVATRKTRSMLKFAGDMFDSKFQDNFSQIAKASNTLRDLDVQINDLDEYQNLLPDSLQKDVRNIIDYLKRIRQDEQNSFVKMLDSDFYQTTLKDWEIELQKERDDKLKTKKFIKGALEKTYSKIISKEITVDTKPKEMHSLRIKFKKFRYLFEYFIDLIEYEDKEHFVKALKDVQKNLGNFQDFQMQQLRAKELSISLFKDDENNIDSIMILGKIATDLAIKQDKTKEEFFDLYTKFKSFDIEKILAF